MTPNFANIENLQSSLFDQDQPVITLPPTLRSQLAMLIEALLLEIGVALATGEVGDEQNHR